MLAEADGWWVWFLEGVFGVGLNCFPRGYGSAETLSVGIPVGAGGVDFYVFVFVFGDFVCFCWDR